jgi:hypothetical protein
MKYLLMALFLLGFVNAGYAQSKSTCSYDIIKPFVGNWKEFALRGNDEIYMGTLKSTVKLDGCVISQHFISSDSGFSYLSFGYIDPASNSWQETYVFNNGNISKYQWQVDGTDVVTRRTGGTRNLDYIHQLRLVIVDANRYDAIEEHSYDGGKSWKKVEVTRIRRIE